MLWGSGGEAPSEKFYTISSVVYVRGTPTNILKEQSNLSKVNVGKESMCRGCTMQYIVNPLDRLRRSKK